MSTPSTAWELPGSDDQTIFGETHTPDTPRGVVLLLHGFKGYKDYGFFPLLAQRFTDAGLIAHRFNFSHSGMTNNTDTFEREDLFEKDTWSRQVSDVMAVCAAITAGELPGAGLPLVLFGHSRGGVSALLAAVELGNAVDRLITAASPHEACSLDAQQRETLRAAGRLPSPSSRTGQTLYVGADWLAEIEAHPQRFDPTRAAAAFNQPHLIVHGKDDPTVPYTASHVLHDTPGGNTTLRIIDGAQHTFNAPNPLPAGQPLDPATQQFIDECVAFATERNDS